MVDDTLLFSLNSYWPTKLLSATPDEMDSPSPRRRHLWLNDTSIVKELPSCWADVHTFAESDCLRIALIELTRRLGGAINSTLRCTARLCEEDLPYILTPHRDMPRKTLSLVWLFTQDVDSGLSTFLYDKMGERYKVKMPANGALCILNSEESFHGGEWFSRSRKTRRSVHIFLTE